jgi:hypothetical protein
MANSQKDQLVSILDSNQLCISKWNGNYLSNGVGSEDWIEIENVQTFGVDELEIGMKVVGGLVEIFKAEESISREMDLKATVKK